MYQSLYSEQIDDAPKECRYREKLAFEHAIDLLRRAEVEDDSTIRKDALQYLFRLWQILLEDLTSPDNDLADDLRADLISIGIWVMKEAEAIRVGSSANFKGLIEICSIIRDGLK